MKSPALELGPKPYKLESSNCMMSKVQFKLKVSMDNFEFSKFERKFVYKYILAKNTHILMYF